MIRFNQSTTLGLYAICELALAPGEVMSAGEIAHRYGVSEHHVAKVLRQLARTGIVLGIRGAGGGFRLARDAREITMLEVVELFEPRRGPSGRTAPAPAPLGARRIAEILDEIDEQSYYTLKSVSIATLVGPKRPT